MSQSKTFARQRARAIGERVSLLVDLSGGSVNAVAKEAGITQPALQALASGRVANPRADSVLALARTFDVSPDWIQNGIGEGPRDERSRSLMISSVLREVMHELQLDGELTDTVLHLATQPGLFALFFSDLTPTQENLRNSARLEGRAVQKISEGWASFLRGLIDTYGAEHVKLLLQRHQNEIRRAVRA